MGNCCSAEQVDNQGDLDLHTPTGALATPYKGPLCGRVGGVGCAQPRHSHLMIRALWSAPVLCVKLTPRGRPCAGSLAPPPQRLVIDKARSMPSADKRASARQATM